MLLVAVKLSIPSADVTGADLLLSERSAEVTSPVLFLAASVTGLSLHDPALAFYPGRAGGTRP
jgi:hypothetical protein